MLRKETLLSSISRAFNPLARKLWKKSVFSYHRFYTPRLWWHCLVNFHQLGTIFTQGAPDPKKPNVGNQVWMVQHFCATCHPQIFEAFVKSGVVKRPNDPPPKTDAPPKI